jgi:ribosomal protein S18 acetylase RimI-like enzyme
VPLCGNARTIRTVSNVVPSTGLTRATSGVRIRAAVLEDEEALADLDRVTWAPDNAVSPRPREGSAFFDLAHPPEQFLVAELARRVVGFIRIVQPVPLPSGDHVRQIQGFAVDPAERGRGVGRLLLDAACEEARRQGARRLTLRVLSVNARARRLYEAAGFVVEGVLPEEFFLAGRYVDDVLMGRRILPP